MRNIAPGCVHVFVQADGNGFWNRFLLPPIIFESGYNMQRKQAYHNKRDVRSSPVVTAYAGRKFFQASRDTFLAIFCFEIHEKERKFKLTNITENYSTAAPEFKGNAC
eukprot:SAG31_NODE_600_length_13647_cov_3.894376_3_plen_108_part_00